MPSGKFRGSIATRRAERGHIKMGVHQENGRAWQCGQRKGEACSEGSLPAGG